MNEKKIVIFMPSIEGGGVEKNFFLISNHLCSIFKQITVITVNKKLIKNRLDKKINIVGPQNFWFKFTSRYPKYFISIIYLICYLLQNKNSLIFAFQANGYASILAKLFNKKIIVRSNSSSEGWSKNNLKKMIYYFILNLPDKVIVNSYQFKKELDFKFKINSYVIYNPLNTKEINKKSKKKLNFPFFKNKHLKIINVGRFVDQKDQFTLLKSLVLIKDKINFKAVLIGKGIYKKKLKDFIIQNKLINNVKILPFQENSLKFIKASNLFVLTSKFEGLPNVLLEAQCLGKYIISTECPTGPKEILMNGKLGDLVKVGDAKKLASKILQFNKNKNKSYVKKRQKLAKRMLKRFDYGFCMSEYEKIIKKFLYF
jgi:glycosyltransferase involved in cell wall biosynthesis